MNNNHSSIPLQRITSRIKDVGGIPVSRAIPGNILILFAGDATAITLPVKNDIKAVTQHHSGKRRREPADGYHRR